MGKEKLKYVDWRKIFSYDADGTIVTGARTTGKTFGFREQLLRDWMNREYRFVMLSRTKDRIPKLSRDFFTKVCLDTEDAKIREWLRTENIGFRAVGNVMQIGNVNKKGKLDNIRDIGSFQQLSTVQDAKEDTFINVRRIALDEAIIEPRDRRYRRYGVDEWGSLANLVQSISRERAGQEAHKPNVYLMANACDVVNPWFQALGIYEVPEYGYHWYRDKTWLLAHLDPSDYEGTGADMLTGTVAGRMLKGTRSADTAAYNRFSEDLEFVAKRPRFADYTCGYIYRGHVYGYWIDYVGGHAFICDEWLQGDNFPMYALTTEDNRVNYIAADYARKSLRQIMDLYGQSLLRFSSVGIKTRFMALLRDFGLR